MVTILQTNTFKINQKDKDLGILECDTTRVAQKVMPHIFFSEAIYSEYMKFTHSVTGCLLYTCYFST
jgi:hypothetical protein